jgi:hypothetical protein
LLSCLVPLIFLLQKTFKLFGFVHTKLHVYIYLCYEAHLIKVIDF